MSAPIFEGRILICVGTGGVGKTTLASTLAWKTASEGKKVLVFTMDPSRRLASFLGLENWTGSEVLVKSFGGNGELWAAMIDPKKVFEDFVRKNSKSEVETKKMLSNRLFQELSTSFSGSQEFTSIQALNEAYKSKKYDFIVLDTPPAQHTLDFIQAPAAIFNLFNGPMVDWFMRLTQKKHGIFSLLNKSTELIIGVLERLTGALFLEELQTFFATVSSWRESIQKTVIETQQVMMGPETQFLLVTNLDDSRINEAEEVIREFKKRGVQIKHVVFNRILMEYKDLLSGTFAPVEGSDQQKVLNFYKKWKSYDHGQISRLVDLRARAFQNVHFWKLYQIAHEDNELLILEKLSKLFQNINV